MFMLENFDVLNVVKKSLVANVPKIILQHVSTIHPNLPAQNIGKIYGQYL
jgi:hypothetical protein